MSSTIENSVKFSIGYRDGSNADVNDFSKGMFIPPCRIDYNEYPSSVKLMPYYFI